MQAEIGHVVLEYRVAFTICGLHFPPFNPASKPPILATRIRRFINSILTQGLRYGTRLPPFARASDWNCTHVTGNLRTPITAWSEGGRNTAGARSTFIRF